MPLLNPGDEVGGWTIERTLDLGARVNTYLVARGDDRAILRLLRTPEGAMADRLLRNAVIAYELNDRNVVRVRGVVEHEGCPGVLSTYFANSHSILSWSQARRRAIPDILEAFDGVFFGLQMLHEAGLIHRNLKPAKVLMVNVRGQQVAKIEDILLSRAEGPEVANAQVTAVGEQIGNAHYMPPEQHLAASSVDHRADLYAAGVVLYEVLTGTRPFDGERLVDIVKAKKAGRLAPPSRYRQDVPADLDALVLSLLSPDPTQRPPTAKAALERINTIWKGATQPAVQARVARRPDQDPPWHQRTAVRVGVVLACVLVLAGVALFAF